MSDLHTEGKVCIGKVGKVCKLAGQIQPLSNFVKDKNCKDGLKNCCRACANTYRREHYLRNREAYKDKKKASDRKFGLRKKYGLTQEQYKAMLELQGGVCAICGGPPSGSSRGSSSFHVDHNHQTGQVRGLLCALCNSGIAHLRERLDLLEAAIIYLKVWS